MSKLIRVHANFASLHYLARRGDHGTIPLYGGAVVPEVFRPFQPEGVVTGAVVLFVALYHNVHKQTYYLKVIDGEKIGWIWIGNLNYIYELNIKEDGETVDYVSVYDPIHDSGGSSIVKLRAAFKEEL